LETMENYNPNIYKQELTSEEYSTLSSTIYKICGINLPDIKKLTVEGRIRKRMKSLNMDSYKSYMSYLLSEKGLKEELISLIDVVTTNKTDFFRENAHFEYLTQTVLPEFIKKSRNRERGNCFQFWSAGCSTGEEPYTLAMVLNEFAERNNDFRFSIHATDISTEVLKQAESGIFELSKTDVVPIGLKKKYLLKSKDPNKQLVRFIPEVRNQIEFSRINLMDDAATFPSKLDVVFCRNVIIYFDKKTQEQVLLKLASKLIPGGYLFLGHSETIMGIKNPLVRVASTIYQKI
jgi:chemotaxis protein methyltransferase CheR